MAALKKIGFMVVLSGCLLLPSAPALYADHDHEEGEESEAGGGPSHIHDAVYEIASHEFFDANAEATDSITNNVFDLLAEDLIPEAHAADAAPYQAPSLPVAPVEIFQKIPADDFASYEVQSADEFVDELLNA